MEGLLRSDYDVEAVIGEALRSLERSMARNPRELIMQAILEGYRHEHQILAGEVADETADADMFGELFVLAAARHGVDKSGPAPNDRAVVYGAGPIGLGATLALKSSGGQHVAVVDLIPAQLDKALKVGAHTVINTVDEDVAQKLIELHGSGDALFFGPSGHGHLLLRRRRARGDRHGAGRGQMWCGQMCRSNAQTTPVRRLHEPDEQTRSPSSDRWVIRPRSSN